MIKERALEVIQFLNKERLASYKEIAKELGYQERVIRYEIERINDELSLSGFEEIQKLKKGMLMVPDKLDLNQILEEGEYIFSSKERKQFIQFRILFNIRWLNIRKLTEEMQVSRRSIQNDLDTIKHEFAQYGITLEYDRKFYLEGKLDGAYDLRVKEMQKYIPILINEKLKGDFEKAMKEEIERIFETLSIERLLQWVENLIRERNWIFSDESFTFYVSNIITYTWYLLNGEPFSAKEWGKRGELGNAVSGYEEIIGRKLEEEEVQILSGFTKYTNRYVNLDIHQDLVTIEDIAINLVKAMGKELGINFLQDGILMKGLLNHLGPMLERVRIGHQLDSNVDFFIPKEQIYIHETLLRIIDKNEYLKNLTENESVYLSIFFIGSIRRMKREQSKNVLLICGYGYGTTTVVKDALISGFQIDIVDSIPMYKLSDYDNWKNIDLIVSTIKISQSVPVPAVQVKVILDEEDYQKLKNLGVQKKKSLTNLLAIERQLNFLSNEDKNHVMKIIQKEMGFAQVRIPEKYYALSDLLQTENICLIDGMKDWRTAVKYCTAMLEQQGYIDTNYYDSIIQGMEQQGFYSVTDGVFALLHGSETAGVNISCMSLLVTREPVYFGEKSVNAIFCLASKDKKEHIPAVIRMMRMIEDTEFITELQKCETNVEVTMLVDKCEKEVEQCYQ